MATTVRMEEIPAEVVLTWDHTGKKVGTTSSWTLVLSGSKYAEMKCANDKHQLTVVFGRHLMGVFFGSSSNLQRQYELLPFVIHFPTGLACNTFP